MVSDVQGASIPAFQVPACEPGGLGLQGARVKAMCGTRYVPGLASSVKGCCCPGDTGYPFWRGLR